VPEDTRPLWPDRHLTDGRLVISVVQRPEAPSTARRRLLDRVVGRSRRAWPEQAVRWLDRRGVRRAAAPLPPGPAAPSPETTLAAWDTTEARVAGAASRAWLETLREPSWHSPLLAGTRAAFDGDAEVRQIVALADRIRQARARLGIRPAGPAAEYWDRQQAALDEAAHRLGDRADALIRHRDQAAALSVELASLADLERLERSAAEVDVLTVETAYGSGRGDGGLGSVAADIAAVRHAMTDLLELMTRTRAPLAEPPDVGG